MNNQKSTEQDLTPDFINLEEYNNLLRELEFIDASKLLQSEITVTIKQPEVIIESIKFIASIFYHISTREYLQHCIISSLSADVDRLLRQHSGYEKLFKLINKRE